jgi:hypothetical protein
VLVPPQKLDNGGIPNMRENGASRVSEMASDLCGCVCRASHSLSVEP